MASSTILMALCWTHAVLQCAGDNVTLPQGRSQRFSIVHHNHAIQLCIGQTMACCCHDKCVRKDLP